MIFIYGEDRIYFAESLMDAKLNVTEASKIDDFDFWRVEGKLIYVDTEYSRVRDLIKYLVKPPEILDKPSLLDYFNRVGKVLDENFYGRDDRGMYPMSIWIADDKSLYAIGGGGRIHKNNTSGICQKEAYTTRNAIDMAICATIPKDMIPKERAKYFFARRSFFTTEKALPAILLNTKDDTFEIIED